MIKFLIPFLFLLNTSVLAQSNLINVEGLSFECETCKKTDNNFCEVPWQGKTLTVLCDSLFEVLLQRAYEEKSENYPKNEELLSLLVRESSNSNASRMVFQILFKRELSQSFSSKLFDVLLEKHQSLIIEAIDKNLFNETQNLILWQKRQLLPVVEVFLLAKNIPGKGLSEFIKELTVVDVDSDRLVINALLDSNVLSLEERDVFGSLNKLIEKCSIDYLCKFESDNQELTKYASRLENSLVTKAILDKKIVNNKAIKILSNTNYVDHRTPETHEALLLVLNELSREKTIAEYWQDLSSQQKDFLSFMAKNDSRVAKLVYSKNTSSVFYWFLGVVLSIISTLGYFYFRSKKIDSVKDTLLLRREIEELNEICSFFDLSADASLRELKQRYRILAREMHPDSGNSKAEDFLKLNNYYKRALELLTNK